ncbi:MAG: hypothetical protein U5R06_19275 [candidate division KSB1 bacterium]|nr:hypothetical protein [candidate division KSB1 bacterium]
MKNGLLYISLLAVVTVAPLHAKGRPEWANLSFIPANHSDLYYAVAQGDLDQEEKTTIRNRALADLASQIRVNISSVMNSVLEDTGDRVTEDTQYRINALTQARFYGEDLHTREYVDNSNVYWVYVFIGKHEYKQRIAERMQTGKKNAMQHLASARSLNNQGDIVMALKSCLKGLDALASFRDLPLTVMVNNQRLNVWNTLEHELSGLAERITLTPVQSEISFSHKDSKKIGYKVLYKGDAGAPLAALPVRFQIQQGRAEINKQGFTDSRGCVFCTLQNSRSSRILVSASLDWTELTAEPATAELAVSHSPATQKRIVQVYTAGPALLYRDNISSDNTALIDAARQSGILKSHLQNVLKQSLNASFVSSSAESNLIVQLNLSVKSLGQLLKQYNSDMITVAVTAHVALLNPATGQTLYTSPSMTVRNLGATESQALTNTLQKCTDRLDSDILPALQDAVLEQQ